MTGTDLCVNLATSVPVIFEPPCTIIASDKKDCYFGTYWPCDFQGVLFQSLLKEHQNLM